MPHVQDIPAFSSPPGGTVPLELLCEGQSQPTSTLFCQAPKVFSFMGLFHLYSWFSESKKVFKIFIPVGTKTFFWLANSFLGISDPQAQSILWLEPAKKKPLLTAVPQEESFSKPVIIRKQLTLRLVCHN